MIRSFLKLFSAEADFLLLFYWFATNFWFCTTGWYVPTKGKSLSLLFCFCFSTKCLESKLTSDNSLSISCLGYLRALRHCLTFTRHYSNVFVFFKEFVLSNLIALPLMKLLFTPRGWHKLRCVYWKVSVGLYWVLMSSKTTLGVRARSHLRPKK